MNASNVCIISRYLMIMMLMFSYSAELLAKQKDFRWNRFRYSLSRYAQADAINIANNIVALQRQTGGWGKTVQPDNDYSTIEFAALLAADRSYELLFDHASYSGRYTHKGSTLDNGATHNHIRFLLRVAESTAIKKYRDAAIKGIEYLLAAQVSSGGWTQNFPNLNSYGGHVTFNDGAMTGAMTALQEASNGRYSFIPAGLVTRIQASLVRGVDFIIKSQIIVNGKKTAWCAQHNRITYEPEGARIYELPSISGLESVAIVRVLMQIPNPSQQVKEAIIAAVKWFDSVKLNDIKVIKVYAEEYSRPITKMIREDPTYLIKKKHTFNGRGYDKKVVFEKNKPLWARFYDLETQAPFFVGWNGIKKPLFSQIGRERRTGYLWYGYWPENLIKRDFLRWKNKWFK